MMFGAAHSALRPQPARRGEAKRHGSATQTATGSRHEAGLSLAKLAATCFWGTLVSLVAAAAASVAVALLFLLPLLALGYLVFCLIALTGDRSVQ